jgi:hypothetical protein
MPLTNPDFDKPLTISHVDVIVRHITSGRMYVYERDEGPMLCEDGKTLGVSLLPYQLTRRGVMQAVAELYPLFTPPIDDTDG